MIRRPVSVIEYNSAENAIYGYIGGGRNFGPVEGDLKANDLEVGVLEATEQGVRLEGRFVVELEMDDGQAEELLAVENY